MRRLTSSLPIAVAGVFAVSFYSYAQLGGAQGIDLPYSGYLEAGGAAVTDTNVDFTFTLYDSAIAASPCDTVDVADVVVVDGRFALVLDDIATACVVGKDTHLEVGVDQDQTGTASLLVGRQRVFPAIAALTSGTGDFAVAGNLAVTGAATVSGTMTVTGTATMGTVNAGALTASSLTAGSVTTTGDLRNTSANGQVGVSADKVFRDTGDNWLRLNTANGGDAYADLAVGQLYAASDFQAAGNSHGACYWTAFISGSIGATGTPAACTTCNQLVCATGYYFAGMKVAHEANNTNYWTGIRIGGLCCQL